MDTVDAVSVSIALDDIELYFCFIDSLEARGLAFGGGYNDTEGMAYGSVSRLDCEELVSSDLENLDSVIAYYC